LTTRMILKPIDGAPNERARRIIEIARPRYVLGPCRADVVGGKVPGASPLMK